MGLLINEEKCGGKIDFSGGRGGIIKFTFIIYTPVSSNLILARFAFSGKY